ncbi:MAG: TIGR04282 family arsenosugar biosynthesis glycosyltransferase [Hyphomonas sp.]|uniref:TIGR04282 family arsenosugar biosynthesis glycosyltransferase n=1 Tax=Hyphomonas sp. TaxID=87 RepID=UPI003526FD4F
MTRATLLIFTKPPRIGLSKTRLAADTSRTTARRIAGFGHARTFRAAAASGCDVRLYVAPDAALNGTVSALWPAGIPRFSQGEGDLGARLEKAWNEAPTGPVLFIGTDAPDISPALLRQAVRLLARHDAIFGPAEDGGFWLFGMNKGPRARAPFRNVRWSGPHAMEDVWSHLPDHAQVGLLPMLMDIDRKEDWHAWSRRPGRWRPPAIHRKKLKGH